MKIFGYEIRKQKKPMQKRASGDASIRDIIRVLTGDEYSSLCCAGYTTLDQNPEVLTACRKIADLISSMTIHLMSNSDNGDVRIINELSRKLDISPNDYMTRKTFMDAVVMNLLLYGKGNSVVRVHTRDGLLGDLEPISPTRIGWQTAGYGYRILIDGVPNDPNADLLHFVLNPDPAYPWMGRGLTCAIKDVANNIKQARNTEKGFMESKWKPSVIVKVDALIEEFSSPEGRKKLLESYVQSSDVGEPWLIPADQFQVDQIRPLSLADLAINDTVEIDKRTIAAMLGVPAFVLGVGEYKQEEWSNFINNTIRPIAKEIEQEMTRKLILSPKWYLKFNIWSLMNWDIQTISSVFGELRKQGVVSGNEVRDRVGMSPRDGLDELVMLENYIPTDKLGDQKKLVQGGKSDDK